MSTTTLELYATNPALIGPTAFLTNLPISVDGLYSHIPGANPILVINEQLDIAGQHRAYFRLMHLHQSVTPERRLSPIKQVLTRA